MLINVGLLVLRGKLKNKKFKESIYVLQMYSKCFYKVLYKTFDCLKKGSTQIQNLSGRTLKGLKWDFSSYG